MSGLELAVRIHTSDSQLPVLLIGRHQDGSLGAGATHEVKAVIPETVPDPVLVSELQYWTESAAPPRRQLKRFAFEV